LENIINKFKVILSDDKKRLVIIFVLGILMLIVSGDKDKSFESKKNRKSVDKYETKSDYKSIAEYEERMENKLKGIIENLAGIEKCEIMITLKSGEEKIVQSNENVNEREEKGESGYKEIQKSNDTLVLKNDNSEYPYITKEIMPVVEGVVIVAKGIENTRTKNEIISIVQALFDIEMHKISIAEMK
jgi:stage III sporulation protein AG